MLRDGFGQNPLDFIRHDTALPLAEDVVLVQADPKRVSADADDV